MVGTDASDPAHAPHPLPAGALGRITLGPTPAADAPSVILRRGQRRAPQLRAPNAVVVDADALRREALLQALVMATQPVEAARAAAASGQADAPPDRVCIGWAGMDPVLVAEDNDVNRRVIERQLRLLGLPAVIVEDGQQALDAWRQAGGRFSLLLTDLHMPGLDGYELCQAIRAEGGVTTPVVALTANALRGEAERCLRSGMDDYISKPVALDRLTTSLQRWLHAPMATVRQAALAPPPPPPPGNGPPHFDPQALARVIGPDAVEQAEVTALFLKSATAALDSLGAHVARRDWPAVVALAHRLKSSARLIGATRFALALDELEVAGRAGAAPCVQALAAALPDVFAALLQAMADSTAQQGGTVPQATTSA